MKAKKPLRIQSDLFGNLPLPKSRNTISLQEKIQRKEKSDAHTAFKLLKSNQFKENLSLYQKRLLKRYYGISL